MQQTISRVQGGRLYPPERSGAQIVVGTSAWYDWLGQHTAFTFVDRIFGYFTAHKRSTVSGEFMWEASLVRARKLYRVVLGPYPTREAADDAGRKLGKPFWVFSRGQAPTTP